MYLMNECKYISLIFVVVLSSLYTHHRASKLLWNRWKFRTSSSQHPKGEVWRCKGERRFAIQLPYSIQNEWGRFSVLFLNWGGEKNSKFTELSSHFSLFLCYIMGSELAGTWMEKTHCVSSLIMGVASRISYDLWYLEKSAIAIIKSAAGLTIFFVHLCPHLRTGWYCSNVYYTDSQ